MFAAAIPASADTADSVTTFTFTDSGITVSAGADETTYSAEGTALTIKKGGSYKVTGSCKDGSVKVKKGISGVTLTLSDLDLTSTTTAPVTCNKNTQADIIIEGTVTLEDNEKNSEDYWYDQGYTDSDTELDEAENAVIKLKGASKVTISGDGTLNINANAKNGIKTGATLDSDLETELAPDSSSEYYAYLTMKDLTVNIDTTSVYTPQSTSTGGNTGWNFGPGGGFGQETETYGDAINSECCLNIESGTYNISAGDDAVKSDYILNLGAAGASNDSLDININESYEGLEGAVINIYSGDIDIIAGDDAVNAANGDLNNYNFALNIYGGDIYADASQGNDNDALDSNGTINIYGGKTVALSDSGGNAIDLDRSITVDGGTVLGIGAAPMDGGTPLSSSKQNWAIWGSSGGFGPGGGSRPGRPGQGNTGTTTGSTNIESSAQSRVTLTSGNTTGIAIGSAPNVTANSKVAVMLDGEKELISTTAPVNASYVFFAGDLSEQSTATLTYSANGKTTTVSANIGDIVTVAQCTEEAEGSVFKEWNTKEDGTGASYAPGDSFAVSSSATLYAIYESTAADEGYKGTFVINGGEASVTTYKTQDYTSGEENQTEAYARDSVTGEISTDGTGQINFKVTPADGYAVESVTAEGKYNAVKLPGDTGAENTYRVTKISGDITITVNLKAASDIDTGTDEDPTGAFTARFAVEGGEASVTTYKTQIYTDGEENQTEAYARESATGAISTDGSGQVNFTVVTADGYAVDKVTVEGEYKNLKTPEETGKENTYRITKITSDLSVVITLKAAAASDTDSEPAGSDTDTATDSETTPEERQPFIGTFVINGGDASITTYDTQDYTNENENQTIAFARDSVTGYITVDGSGQINFKVIPAEGYEVESVTAEGGYKNLKTPDETGAENTYRVTKITGDVTVTITLKETSEPINSDSDTDSDTDPEITDTETDSEPDQTEPFKGTFAVNGGDASITVYATQEYTNGEENQTSAFARDSVTGEILTDGNGQINFKVTPAEGYEVESVTAEGGYKNLKTPDETGAENTYRVTKITGDVTITVTLKKSELDPDDIPDIDPDIDEIVNVLFGDTTQDGSIFSDDALLALRHSLTIVELEGIEKAVGDVNQDGVVDSADALLILRCSVGLSDTGSLAGVYKNISLVTWTIKD